MQECKREAWEHREQEENIAEAEGSVELESGTGFLCSKMLVMMSITFKRMKITNEIMASPT